MDPTTMTYVVWVTQSLVAGQVVSVFTVFYGVSV